MSCEYFSCLPMTIECLTLPRFPRMVLRRELYVDTSDDEDAELAQRNEWNQPTTDEVPTEGPGCLETITTLCESVGSQPVSLPHEYTYEHGAKISSCSLYIRLGAICQHLLCRVPIRRLSMNGMIESMVICL